MANTPAINDVAFLSGEYSDDARLAAIRDYIRATRFTELAQRIPALPDGLIVSAAGSVFIATT